MKEIKDGRGVYLGRRMVGKEGVAHDGVKKGVINHHAVAVKGVIWHLQP